MRYAAIRSRPLLLVALLTLCGPSCRGGGKRFYAVRGHVFVNGQPAAGVQIVFHPDGAVDAQAVQPSAVVGKDGSFALQSWVVDQRALKKGAPAGRYLVTCIWYPPDLDKYVGREVLPDRLQGRYAVPKDSGLRAEIPEQAIELPPFQLEATKR
jgi:hypothetical protein